MRCVGPARPRPGLALAVAALLVAAWPNFSDAGEFQVQPRPVPVAVPAVAQIGTAHTVPARVRSGGTLRAVLVHRGDQVRAGQILAEITDRGRELAVVSARAARDAAEARLARDRADLARDAPLVQSGAMPRQQHDQLATRVVLDAAARAAASARLAAAEQRMAEGAVRAPGDGRVLTLPVTAGVVMRPGEVVAELAVGPPVLHLAVPEAWADRLVVGGVVRGDWGVAQIIRVFPRITDGMAHADAAGPDLPAGFTGRVVAAWVPFAGPPALVVPADAIHHRSGMDFVMLSGPDGPLSVPVQLGQARVGLTAAGGTDGVVVLAGLVAGDRLIVP